MNRTPLDEITESDQQRLWKQAQKLAHPYRTDQSDNKNKYLLFELNTAIFALENRFVREVLKLPAITHLPCCPSFVSGVINLRGQITSVLELSSLLDFSPSSSQQTGWAVVLASQVQEFAFRADSIPGIHLISPDEIYPLLAIFTGLGAKFALGLWKEQIVVLDGAKLLADEQLVVSESVDL